MRNRNEYNNWFIMCSYEFHILSVWIITRYGTPCHRDWLELEYVHDSYTPEHYM